MCPEELMADIEQAFIDELDAKARFSELVRLAGKAGPQHVTTPT
jgi:hypothetical protein